MSSANQLIVKNTLIIPSVFCLVTDATRKTLKLVQTLRNSSVELHELSVIKDT